MYPFFGFVVTTISTGFTECSMRMGIICFIRIVFFFFFQAEDGIRDTSVTGVQTCALPICVDARRPDREPEQAQQQECRERGEQAGPDRKSVVEGQSVDLGGRRISKKQ